MSSKNIYTQKIKNKYIQHKGYDYVPYVYLVKCIPTGKVYYGSRFSKYAHPDFFFVDYFTSSKIIHEMILSYGIENFQFEIRKKFRTREECIKWENTVLRRMKVSKHEKFINIDENQKIHDNRNTIVISNQVTLKCIRIKNTSEIFPGWIRGNINFKNPTINERRWFHDPVTGESHHVPENEKLAHWVSGRGSSYKSNSETLKKKEIVSITDGINNKFINKNDELPRGWRYGRSKTEEERKNNELANKLTIGCFYVNNGIVNKRMPKDSPIPEGWVKGKLKRK